jgi:hypothetical protein
MASTKALTQIPEDLATAAHEDILPARPEREVQPTGGSGPVSTASNGPLGGSEVLPRR